MNPKLASCIAEAQRRYDGWAPEMVSDIATYSYTCATQDHCADDPTGTPLAVDEARIDAAIDAAIREVGHEAEGFTRRLIGSAIRAYDAKAQGEAAPVAVPEPDQYKALTELQASLRAGEASDGHHTHNELYAYRRAYNALLFNEWARQDLYGVHKSRRHSDGEPCFGSEDWFVVVAQLPTGQVSNHYRMKWWDQFAVPERDRAAEWDGHTPAVALERLEGMLSPLGHIYGILDDPSIPDGYERMPEGTEPKEGDAMLVNGHVWPLIESDQGLRIVCTSARSSAFILGLFGGIFLRRKPAPDPYRPVEDEKSCPPETHLDRLIATVEDIEDDMDRKMQGGEGDDSAWLLGIRHLLALARKDEDYWGNKLGGTQ